jgi:hypothetical protein
MQVHHLISVDGWNDVISSFSRSSQAPPYLKCDVGYRARIVIKEEPDLSAHLVISLVDTTYLCRGHLLGQSLAATESFTPST